MCSTMASNNGKYGFPYPAYDIQTTLMDTLYEAMDGNKVAIVESPTGTGKSLSIICSAIKWIQDFEAKEITRLSQELEVINNRIKELDDKCKDNSDWIKLQNEKSIVCHKKEQIVHELSHFDVKKKRNEDLIQRKHNSSLKQSFDSKLKNPPKRLKIDENCDLDTSKLDTDADEDLLDYSSDDEFSEDNSKPEEEKIYVRPKIYYCSRTHSQLSQFISEIKKTDYSREERPLRTVALASRSNYCINDSVLKLNNSNLINEKCIELQKSSNNKLKCQMYRKAVMNDFKDEVLADVLDIEDIVKIGRGIKACPYYTTRLAVPEAEIVIVPYNVLLHSATRDSLGVSLKDSIVIVDESHNLMETIHNIHSIELKGCHVIDCLTQLNNYSIKYKTRLSARNKMHIKQIIFILNELLKHFKQLTNDSSNVLDRVEFLIRLKIENLNLYKILDFCEKSKIARKLFGFNQKHKLNANLNNSEEENTVAKGTTAFLAKMKAKSVDIKPVIPETSKTEEQKSFGSPLYIILEFLRSLMNTKANAKVVTNLDKNSVRDSSIKYILLSPDSYFKDIINECRSVILCGGTMKPFEEFIDHLFTPLGVTTDRMLTFSCGHVIPDDNLLAIGLSVGPNQMPLNYTFQNRNNKSLIEETGKTMANLCAIIPGGVVCFFPSYDFEDLYFNSWQKSSIVKSIESKGKRVLREPKKASQVSAILADYNRAISCGKGALLLCVVGAKMSEGINFSDQLGRGVVVVGLPYPNKSSVELQQKINYFNAMKADSGNRFYENLCMKAVNQSIGRSIRHKNDFAVIILLDNRYTTRTNVKQNLPDWIRSRYKCFDKFGPAFSSVRQFFAKKRC